MRFLIAIVVGLLPCSQSLLANTSDHEIRAFIADYDREYSQRDMEALAARLSADYRVTVGGKTMDRAGSLADPKSESAEPGSVKSTVAYVDVDGNLAAARGTIEWSEGDRSGWEHFLLVLKRENGEWRALMEYLSPVPRDLPAK